MNERPPIRTLLRDGVDEPRLQQIWQRVYARRRSRLWARRVLVPTLATACAVAALIAINRPAHDRDAVAVRDPLRLASGEPLVASASIEVGERAKERVVALSDGTRITLGAGGVLVPRTSTSERLELAVERGRARFEVQPQRGRRFMVSAGAVTVEVVGTVFSVANGALGAEVAVEHGRVRVRAEGMPNGERSLGAGESLRWPQPTAVPPAPAPATTPAPAIRDSAVPAAADKGTPPRASSPAFRAAVQSGDYAHAYALLGPIGYARAVGAEREIDRLLELADVARGASKPRLASLALARIIELHPEGDRSALAALTLGRLQLDVLAQPGAAARSLRIALAVGLPVALQEDALARLVNASARAGQQADAESAAAQYHLRFPDGRWRASVDQWVNRR